MTAFQWSVLLIVLVIAIIIVVPVVRRILQDRDFKRQLEGRRPMRESKGSEFSSAEPIPFTPELEACKRETWFRAVKMGWIR